MKKKLFVLSDVHGHYTQMLEALNKAGFERNNPEHLLISCGDCFDRGRENYEVLKYLERLDNAVLIKGNHDEMLIDIIYAERLEEHHFINGTDVTIEQLFGRGRINPDNSISFSGCSREVDRVLGFLEGMRDYYETENYVFTHGWVPNTNCIIDKNWRYADKEKWKKARWNYWTVMLLQGDRIEDKKLVVGHRSTSYASRFDLRRSPECYLPFELDGVIAIDGCTVVSGRVNVLVLEDNLLESEDVLPKGDVNNEKKN